MPSARGRGASLGELIWIQDVPGRTDIAIHAGNTPEDTKGCVLVGCTAESDRVSQSRAALDQMLSFVDGVVESDRAAGEATNIIIEIQDSSGEVQSEDTREEQPEPK